MQHILQHIRLASKFRPDRPDRKRNTKTINDRCVHIWLLFAVTSQSWCHFWCVWSQLPRIAWLSCQPKSQHQHQLTQRNDESLHLPRFQHIATFRHQPGDTWASWALLVAVPKVQLLLNPNLPPVRGSGSSGPADGRIWDGERCGSVRLVIGCEWYSMGVSQAIGNPKVLVGLLP